MTTADLSIASLPTKGMNQRRRALSPTKGYSDIVLLGAVFVLGLGLRIFFAAHVSIVPPDGAFYGMLARKFLTQGLWDSLHVYWSPLYPIFIGLGAFVLDDFELAGRVVSVLCGAALVIPIYWLSRRFYGRDTATIAITLVATYPFLIERSTQVSTESLYTLLFALVLLAGWWALEHEQLRYYAITGALFGLLYLTRAEAFLFAFLFAALAVSQGLWRSGKGVLWKGAFGAIILLVSFILVASPYLMFIHHQTGRWSPGLRSINIQLHADEGESQDSRQKSAHREDDNMLYKISPDGSFTLADRIMADGKVQGYALFEHEAAAGLGVGQRVNTIVERLYKVYHTYQPTLLPGFILSLLALGLCATPWNKQRFGREAYLLILVSCTIFGYALVHVKERYFAGVIPIFLMWAAHGLLFFGRWLRDSLHESFGLSSPWVSLGTPLALMVILVSFTPKYIKFASVANALPRAIEHKQAGLWAKANLGTGLTIMSRKPYVAFYAEGRHLYIPDEDYSDIIAYASRQGVDLLVIDEEWIPSERPQLQFLFDDQAAPRQLIPTYNNNMTHRKIILYRLEKLLRY